MCALGAAAAQLLGIDHVFPGERVWAGNMWLYIAGILKPDVLSPDVDSSVLVGCPFAGRSYGLRMTRLIRRSSTPTATF